MLKLTALLAALVFASPAVAMNEMAGQPLSKVEEMSARHGIKVEKLNDADTALMDARTSPRPQPSNIYLLTLGPSVIILLVREDVVIFSGDPIELETINKVLNRSGV